MISLIGPINKKMVQSFVQQLEEHLAEDSELVQIRLTSEGGSTPDAMAIVAIIRELQHNNIVVSIQAAGYVMSAAVGILAVANIRYMDKYSWVMTHDEEVSVTDMKAKDMDALVKQTAREADMWYQLMTDHTKKDRAYWETLDRADTYLTAQECFDAGLIDEII